MPIDFNKLGINGERDRNPSGTSGEKTGNPGKKDRRIYPFSIFKKNRAQDRARKASEHLRQEQLKEQEERSRRQRLEGLTAEIKTIIDTEQARPLNVPSIDRGLTTLIGRLAKDNPEKALSAANGYVNQVKKHNEAIFVYHKMLEQQAIRAKNKKDELNKQPIRTFWDEKRKVEDEPTFARKTLRGVVNTISVTTRTAVRGATAVFNATPSLAFNDLEVNGKGLTTFQPFQAISSRTITHDDLPNHIIAVNPPRYLDSLYGFVGAILGRDKAEKILPIGSIEVIDRPGRITVGQAVSLFPGRKKQVMEQSLRDSYVPDVGIPRFEPEPDLASLLGDAAKTLGIEQQKPRSESEKQKNSMRFE